MRGASDLINLFGGLYPSPSISMGEVWVSPPPPVLCGSLALAVALSVVVLILHLSCIPLIQYKPTFQKVICPLIKGIHELECISIGFWTPHTQCFK